MRRVGFVHQCIQIKPDRMRELLHDQNQPDGGEHAADHGRGKIGADYPRLHRTQQPLQDAGKHNRNQKRLKPADSVNAMQHDNCQPGRRPRHAELRAAQEGNHQSSDNARHQSGEQRRPGGQCDSETQGQRHQKHHQTGRQVVAKILQVIGQCFACHGSAPGRVCRFGLRFRYETIKSVEAAHFNPSASRPCQ